MIFAAIREYRLLAIAFHDPWSDRPVIRARLWNRCQYFVVHRWVFATNMYIYIYIYIYIYAEPCLCWPKLQTVSSATLTKRQETKPPAWWLVPRAASATSPRGSSCPPCPTQRRTHFPSHMCLFVCPCWWLCVLMVRFVCFVLIPISDVWRNASTRKRTPRCGSSIPSACCVNSASSVRRPTVHCRAYTRVTRHKIAQHETTCITWNDATRHR